MGLHKSAPSRAPQEDGVIPFSYRAHDEALADLRQRLDHARWPDKETASGWEQGPPLTKLQRLVGYWRTDYNWRRCESELDRWPQFKTTIDGLGIHYIHIRSRHPNALPLILTHGWPSTVLLFRNVIGPLTDPTEHDGTSDDAFDVIIPSLPGFGFSDKPASRGWNAARTASAWGILMQRLGYTWYVAQGGDWGAFVTSAMAQQRSPGLAAIHLNFTPSMPEQIPTDLLPDQRRVVEVMKTWREKASAYSQLQSTRPQLAGYVLSDSPLAQAALIYDMFNAGTGFTGDPEAIISRDAILDEITLYWLTNSAASSARFYLEQSEVLGTRYNPRPVEREKPTATLSFSSEWLPAENPWKVAEIS